MRTALRPLLAGLFCAGAAVAAVYLLSDAGSGGAGRPEAPGVSQRPAPAPADAERGPSRLPPVPLYGAGTFDDSGYPLSTNFTGTVRDRGSLAELREAYRGRAGRGITELRRKLASLTAAPLRSPEQGALACQLRMMIASLHMAEGQFAEAGALLGEALDAASAAGLPAPLLANVRAMRGVAALRRGETENCVACLGPSSCILPLAPEAVHQFPSGSREAVRHLTEYLRERPEDFGVRWLLNVAYMTLGQYPDRVPPEYLFPPERPAAVPGLGRFVNVAPDVGLNARGPNLLGGSLFDDFNGDGLPDIFVTSFDIDLGSSLFVNRGDGHFEERSGSSGLASQVLAVNASHADFDNDGDLDVLIIRGGWENPMPLSLLRNRGDGVFDDVTAVAGLAEPIASHSAPWGDFDNDGLVDLFVCGEYLDNNIPWLSGGGDSLHKADPRNRCRLYKNRGDGTFTDVAASAGVLNEHFAKGAAWGDYDGDGWLDLYVSNMGNSHRLYHNQGDGTFRDVALELGVTDPIHSFACWFWDYDNDGLLDLFATGYASSLIEFATERFGRPVSNINRPRLYRNRGPLGFVDVSRSAGLGRVLLPMGASFGDIDNDGYLDFYLGTGRPAYSFLDPNVMFKNIEGRRFEDVTAVTGTGHLQKGHGVSFADYDGDGDLDLFAELGGAVPGDRAHNVLFRNPGNGRHWLKVKLVGTKTNRAALGARIRVDLPGPGGATRSIYRTVGGGSSYGGNSLVETIGLGDAATVAALTVTWPVSRSSRTFRDVPADRFVEVTEGSDSLKRLDPAPRPGPSGR